MGNALLAGVSGLKAHQTMLDVTGNNLANLNTYGFKGSRTVFADMLSSTLREATEPTDNTGGTNPIQVGSGTQVASVDRIMTQGGLVTTGQPLDMAIEGEGYFVLNNGQTDAFTRVGSFAVDSDYYLVDPGTGYRVQRFGTEGEVEGFQTNDSIKIPYDVTLEAQATANISVSGNLNGDASTPTTNMLGSGLQYTAPGEVITDSTRLVDLNETSGLIDGDEIQITGTNFDGTPVVATYIIADAATAEMGDLLTAISTAFNDDSIASVLNGEIRLTDDAAGYSHTDMMLEFTATGGGVPTGTFTMPEYFQILEAGGEASQDVSIEIFDSQGIGHNLSASFVSNTAGDWDLVVTSVTGEVDALNDRRISGITFQENGNYGGIEGTPPDDPTFGLTFSNAPDTIRSITVDFGLVGGRQITVSGEEVGLATVSMDDQDGYTSGQLASMSVTQEGILAGLFTNGVTQNIASIKMAVFQNPAGLAALGNNYFVASGNSGDPLYTRGMSGGAGTIRGGSLEQSNVDVAGEFVNLIQAQNGYQANARTIKVANEMLKELANLIR
ncbi:MAG: flagellar hook-basal body complex protein [Phycisphaerae bacterium]|nr:flagellar hook-basal body complex protein [Phycisphaerae bacterium]